MHDPATTKAKACIVRHVKSVVLKFELLLSQTFGSKSSILVTDHKIFQRGIWEIVNLFWSAIHYSGIVSIAY